MIDKKAIEFEELSKTKQRCLEHELKLIEQKKKQKKEEKMRKKENVIRKCKEY